MTRRPQRDRQTARPTKPRPAEGASPTRARRSEPRRATGRPRAAARRVAKTAKRAERARAASSRSRLDRSVGRERRDGARGGFVGWVLGGLVGARDRARARGARRSTRVARWKRASGRTDAGVAARRLAAPRKENLLVIGVDGRAGDRLPRDARRPEARAGVRHRDPRRRVRRGARAGLRAHRRQLSRRGRSVSLSAVSQLPVRAVRALRRGPRRRRTRTRSKRQTVARLLAAQTVDEPERSGARRARRAVHRQDPTEERRPRAAAGASRSRSATQTYFEPQRDQIADLLKSWWGVKLGHAAAGDAGHHLQRCRARPGIAGEAAQQLIRAGFRVVDTKNADQFDYETDADRRAPAADPAAGAAASRDVLGVGKVVEQAGRPERGRRDRHHRQGLQAAGEAAGPAAPKEGLRWTPRDYALAGRRGRRRTRRPTTSSCSTSRELLVVTDYFVIATGQHRPPGRRPSPTRSRTSCARSAGLKPDRPRGRARGAVGPARLRRPRRARLPARGARVLPPREAVERRARGSSCPRASTAGRRSTAASRGRASRREPAEDVVTRTALRRATASSSRSSPSPPCGAGRSSWSRTRSRATRSTRSSGWRFAIAVVAFVVLFPRTFCAARPRHAARWGCSRARSSRPATSSRRGGCRARRRRKAAFITGHVRRHHAAAAGRRAAAAAAAGDARRRRRGASAACGCSPGPASGGWTVGRHARRCCARSRTRSHMIVLGSRRASATTSRALTLVQLATCARRVRRDRRSSTEHAALPTGRRRVGRRCS